MLGQGVGPDHRRGVRYCLTGIGRKRTMIARCADVALGVLKEVLLDCYRAAARVRSAERVPAMAWQVRNWFCLRGAFDLDGGLERRQRLFLTGYAIAGGAPPVMAKPALLLSLPPIAVGP